MSVKARVLWHRNESSSELKDIDFIEEGILVDPAFSMVSLGTERIVASGRVPQESIDKMRVPHMFGALDLPCSYGYSMIGKAGQRFVHLMHPHQDKIYANPDELFEIPDLNPRYVLLSNFETALNIFWDANPKPSDSILILGAGLIGCLTASIFIKEGFEPGLWDIDEVRSDRIRGLGFPKTQKKLEYDLIINTTGNPDALQSAIDLSAPAATIIEASWFGKNPVKLNLGDKFHYNRLSIKSSQVSSISPNAGRHVDFRRRKEKCLEYLKDDNYDKFIDKVIDFEELPNEFERIRSGDCPYLSLTVKY